VHNSTLGGYFEILAETNGRLNHASDAKLKIPAKPPTDSDMMSPGIPI
jgi:hypothetical protein